MDGLTSRRVEGAAIVLVLLCGCATFFCVFSGTVPVASHLSTVLWLFVVYLFGTKNSFDPVMNSHYTSALQYPFHGVEDVVAIS